MTSNQIKAQCAQKRITLKDLLTMAGVNSSTWWRWETNRYQPRAGSIERIKQAFERLEK